MRLNRLAAALVIAIPAAAAVAGCGVTQHGAAAAAHSVTPAAVRPASSQPASSQPASPHPASAHLVAATTSPPANPAVLWLGSAGGQAQVTFNDDVDTVAGALEIESQSPTVANHLAFEADARVMRTEARKILSSHALLPTVHRAAYVKMLKDFVVVANLLQPGPDYGTTAQDNAAWYTALRASNISVS